MGNRIIIAGDWHGHTSWALRCVKKAHEHGIREIVHVGDFGLGFQNDDTFLKPLEELAKTLGIAIIVVPGNHENWDDIAALHVQPLGRYRGFLRAAENIFIVPRGHRWQMGELTFVGLGGGNSIDYQRRTQGHSWWREEAISQADLYRTIDGGHADVMIAHVAPFNAVYELDSDGWNHTALTYSNESRMVMGYAVDEVKPDIFFHGHYHIDKRQVVTAKDEAGNPYTTEYVSLNRNDMPNNMAFFDLDTRAVDFIRYPY